MDDERRPVGSIDVRGTKVDVFTSQDRAKGIVFTAALGPEYFSAPDFEALKRKLMNASKVKAAKVAIGFVLVGRPDWGHDDRKILHGVATGIHGSNGNLLGKMDTDTQAGQLTHVWGSDVMRELNDEEMLELRRLIDVLELAERMFKAFTEEHALDVKEAVTDAIARATEGTDDAEA